MAQILYTPVGQMDRVVDFWQQSTLPNPDGSLSDPSLFASGVFAKIEALWSTTQARRHQQQVDSELTHRITIRYLPKLKSSMFILYADPDFDPTGTETWQQGRRFDIDSVNDPDEKKVELQILAIERNDGQ